MHQITRMWLILAVLLTTASCQISEESPWGHYDDDREQNPNYGYRNTFSSSSAIIKDPTYFVVASRMCRPGQVYRVAVDVLHSPVPLTIRASILRNGVEISADDKDVKIGVPETLMIRMPPTAINGDYKLRVEGLYNGRTGGQAFLNETYLTFSTRAMTIFIQLDKPVYMQGQTVNFRAVPIDTQLKAFTDPVDVYMRDPHGRIMRRWLSRQSNLGTVSLSYQLSDQPVFGNWAIQVIAQGQSEELSFIVEEYYQTRFEVNVTMPAFFFSTDSHIHGIIQANYTSGAPVRGNLTIKASFHNINSYRNEYNENPVTDRYFIFNEQYPSWFNRPDMIYDPSVLRFFNGTYEFKFSMEDLRASIQDLNEMEVQITATVGERFLDEVIVGYSKARIFKSIVKVHFFGGSPQVFKPAMPYTLNIVASFHDNSPLRESQVANAQMKVEGSVEMRSSGVRAIEPRFLYASPENPTIWTMKIDLRDLLHLTDNQRDRQILRDVSVIRIHATFVDGEGNIAEENLLLLAHESPDQKHIKVTTSTTDPKVGHYLILHVQSNFYVETFNYVLMSKGTVVLTGQDIMEQNSRTFSIPLSPEMSPVATVVVYHVGRYGEVVADSLTVPVDGISRNNFTIFINNKKAKTGEKVEVAIYGEPGTHVALSGVDRAFYSMQAGNEITYANVISKMSYFGEETNGTHSHSWLHHEGDPDDVVYFPSSTYGIDVNRTFEYVGLVVFTDAFVYRRPGYCNITQGYAECLTGKCYRLEKKCDGVMDCEDGTDETRCNFNNATDLSNFRINRYNRIQRLYDNVWLWKDINIDPHGRQIFDIEVPRRPVHWMITAFAMSPTRGFSMLPKALEYTGVLPFYINVEMPTNCRQGEQIGIRVSVFNYMTYDIEATVVLVGSSDYKFVHVEDNGIVKSYNPRTSFGDHQFFIWIAAQNAEIVYLPIVPLRLGDIKVQVYAMTIMGKDVVERNLHVEADGLPQYRHQSVLLDLSTRGYLVHYMHVNITETPIVSYTEERYYILGSNKAKISIVGDVVGPIFPTMPINATSLLGLPMDSAEQNMFSFATHLYTTMYMRKITQRNFTQESESFHYMNILYQRQLSFLKPDGSFGLFRNDWNQSASSVWLTAFCARIFREASFYEWENYLYIDPKVITDAVYWILQHQTPEGAFYEVTSYPDRKMNSTLKTPDDIRYRNITLTAHVLITLEVVKDMTGTLGGDVASKATKARNWLEKNLNLLSRSGTSYEVAIVAYALQLSNSYAATNASLILKDHAKYEGEFTYWGRVRVPAPPTKKENNLQYALPRLPYSYDSENIETTAYALLVFVPRQDSLAYSTMKWLNAQRLTDGGWASTQDTAWAMKALIEYTDRSRIRDVSQLTVKVEPTALVGKSKVFHVNNKNIAKLQTLDIPDAWGTVKISAVGAGYAILQMMVQYNVDKQAFQTPPPIKAFDLTVRPNFHGRNQSHISYLSCQRWTNLNESERSGMAVLDLTIPTGYIIQQQNLDKYILSRQVRNLQRARFVQQKVLFYFDYLDYEETCVNFTVERWYPVANMSRYLAVRVYDYYAPERFNETIFDAEPTYLLNICEVCGSSQCPYCPIYNAALLLATPTSFVLILLAVITTLWYFNVYELSVG